MRQQSLAKWWWWWWWWFVTTESLSGSSVHGTSQARILQWVAIAFSRGASQPRDGTSISWGMEPASPEGWNPPALQMDSLLLSHQGSPHWQSKHPEFPLSSTIPCPMFGKQGVSITHEFAKWFSLPRISSTSSLCFLSLYFEGYLQFYPITVRDRWNRKQGKDQMNGGDWRVHRNPLLTWFNLGRGR